MGLFSKKKKDAEANPYAQAGTAPAPAVSNTPPPSYHSPSIASSRYGDEKLGTQNGYGADRYGSGPAPGGYGGFNPAGNNRSQASTATPAAGDGNPALFGNAKDRYNPYGGSKPQAQSGPEGDEYGGYGAPRELTEEEQAEADTQALVDQTNAVRDESWASIQRTIGGIEGGLAQVQASRMRVAQQDSRLNNAERNLDQSLSHARDGAQKTKTLDTLNRKPFFMPVGGTSVKAVERQVAQETEEHSGDKAKAEVTRQARWEIEKRLKAAEKNGPTAPGLLGSKKPVDSKWVFEDDEEGAAKEENIQAGIETLGYLSGQLNSQASALGDDLQQSIKVINRVVDKVWSPFPRWLQTNLLTFDAG
uniref:Vegetative incompatibility protein 2a n=1 Tax=Cryphonectria parasitica TaxID=5116 RepID=G8H3Q4_CRYPA|nr:vegetative incompatibility protein 2a [Cryphonectria parasitica]